MGWVCVAAACGGGGGGATGAGGGAAGGSTGAAVVIPSVPAGEHEAACASLCALPAGETICTAKHAEFCLASCRASTQGLSAACAGCVLGAGQAKAISGFTIGGDSYCDVGGPGKLSDCAAACDDAGAAPPDPDLEALCELDCGFYMQSPKPFACPPASSADCLSGCRNAVAAKGRICAQCLAEQIIPGQSCINDDCQCLNEFAASSSDCASLCDTSPAM